MDRQSDELRSTERSAVAAKDRIDMSKEEIFLVSLTLLPQNQALYISLKN
jgi:hypothetical protein